MQYQYIHYIWPSLASAFITASLGVFAFIKRKHSKGAAGFMASMIILTLWCVSSALEMSGADYKTKLFWINVEYLAYSFSPVTLFALCTEFTGFEKWVRNKRILWFAVLPAIITVLVWTNEFHGLMRYNTQIDCSGLFPVITKQYGPAFYVHTAYSYSLIIFAWLLLIRATFFKNTVYSRQALSLFIGLTILIMPNFLYVAHIIPAYKFDVTPVSFGPAGIVVAWGIFRYKLFDIVPVAWAKVIKTMNAGVIVLDIKNRVLDINPAFEEIIANTSENVLAKHVKEACGSIPELVKLCMDKSSAHAELSINKDDNTKIYEVFFSPLLDNKDTPIGRLAVFYEETEKKQAQQKLLKQQWQLAVNEERERMARDLHDNLGQILGFINLQAQGIRQELKNSGIEIAADKLDKLADVTQSAHSELREYIQSIRNPAYVEIDFITALKNEITSFKEQTELNVKLDIDGFTEQQVNPEIRIHILSIIKEALNNIAKHAEAENVKIFIRLIKQQLYAVVEDDGKGFDTVHNSNHIKTKFGLDIMRERAEKIGGTLCVESKLGKGCRITLNVPVCKENDKNETVVG